MVVQKTKRDYYNREKGIRRLERKLLSNKLTKKQINNRGYNKYLKLIGDLRVEIDYEKFNEDSKWDGLKGYVTNCKLSKDKVIESYRDLWQIEKAFRISKTDLKVRPIYHYLRDRIQAHICIAFVAYSIYKELERLLEKHNVPFSAKRAIELTETMYAIDVLLPESKQKKTIRPVLSDEEKLLLEIFI